jgi:hypothetical protein
VEDFFVIGSITNVGVKRLLGQNKSNYEDEDLSLK